LLTMLSACAPPGHADGQTDCRKQFYP
jgi:hypothetical protein